MSYLYFDIETIPCQDPECLEELRKNVTAPAQYKKPESIEKWMEENRETAAREALDKTSFDGWAGHVCCIAWAVDDGEVKGAFDVTIHLESAVIESFFDAIDKYHSQVLVGHNILGFDIPFLTRRAVALGVKLPTALNWPRDPKPWERSVDDTMVMAAGGRGSISLDNLCKRLGIPGKNGFDGSQVAAAWEAGEYEKIAEYCRDDVERVRAVHRKFMQAGW